MPLKQRNIGVAHPGPFTAGRDQGLGRGNGEKRNADYAEVNKTHTKASF